MHRGHRYLHPQDSDAGEEGGLGKEWGAIDFDPIRKKKGKRDTELSLQHDDSFSSTGSAMFTVFPVLT